MLRGYVFRMYPNNKQEEIINKNIGNSRFVYNYFLDEKIKEYKETKTSKNAYAQIKTLPKLYEEYPWLKEGDSCALRNSLFNLEDSYKRFYKGNGFPKFKAKGINDSYKTNNNKGEYKGNKYESIKIDLERKIITLPKLKEVKIRGYRNKKLKNLSIRKWECAKCGSIHDRDYNASENILFEGIKIYMKELEQGV